MTPNIVGSKPLRRVLLETDGITRQVMRFVKRPIKKPGTSPGTIVPVGEKRAAQSRITVMEYDPAQLREQIPSDGEEALGPLGPDTVRWINIDGLHDVALLEKIGARFNIHPLTLEDIVNTGHRPKAEDFDGYAFVVFKMLYYGEQREHIETEQISLVVGNGFLISFQENVGDVFEPVRERLRKSRGRIRKAGSDYLAYALIDASVDHYFLVLETVAEKIGVLEEHLLIDPQAGMLQQLHELKREMIFLRKQVWPMRELLSRLAKEESAFFSETTDVYLRDVYDHTVQVIDTIESFRDMLSGLLDVYLSTASNRMNEVMKLLTVIATIFIPMTFIAGIYGMNFKYMPELQWRWSYPLLWLFLVGLFVTMVVWFKKKKWL
jgi:magnesium transporter